MLHIKSGEQLIGKCPPRITPSQKVIVKDTWQILKLNIANVGVKTFVGMFESRPELIQIFGAFDGQELPSLQHSGLIHEHALRVMATVDAVVTQIDDRRTLARTLKDVGQKHRKYNVPSNIIPTILPHFLVAIKPHIDATWSDEVSESWTALFDILIYYMTEGELQNSVPINSGHSACRNVDNHEHNCNGSRHKS
ncbi:neuroglobin-like [Mya arenaria]|uniref:neuroglobin-like n=1 Tax=Mya arenaria TaxID=6604 RepID=UPI0022E933CD|nr:neuroglobin-like [Mya arenaria]